MSLWCLIAAAGWLVTDAGAVPLDQAVEAAIERSPLSDVADARMAEAAAQVAQADSYLLPQVEAGVGFAVQNEISYWIGDDLDTTALPVDPRAFPEMLIQPQLQLQSQLVAQQGIYSPSVMAWRKAARENESWARAQGDQDAVIVVEAVLEAWHASARFQALETDAVAALELATRLSEVGDALIEHGAATEDDLLPIRQAAAQARAGLVRAQAAGRAADAALNTLTGLAGRADPISVPTEAPELDALLGRIDHPDLTAAQARTRAAEAQADAESRAAWPLIGVTGSAYYLAPAADTMDNFNWQILLGAQIPIYKGGSVKAKTDAANAQAARSQAGESALRYQLEIELIQQHGALTTALAALAEHEEGVSLGQQAVAAAEVRFREGSGSTFELQQAQIALAQSQALLTTARHDAALSRDRMLLALSGEVSHSAALRAFPQGRDREMLE